MTMEEARRVYRDSESHVVFRQFVNMVFHCLMNGDLSIYEVRDACTLGMNMYAERKPPDPILVTKEQAEQLLQGKMMTEKS